MGNIDHEGPILRSIIAYLHQVIPNTPVIHHGANEFGMSGKDVARQIAKNTFNGALKGWPDIIMLPPANIGPVFFEVKAPKGKISTHQQNVASRLKELGYRFAFVQSIDDVKMWLDAWGIYRTDRRAELSTTGAE